jgi:hypothetical protein
MTKKLKINILLLFIISASFTFGQSYVGVFGGLNSSKLAGDAPSKAYYKSLMGVNIGGYFDLKLGKSVWLSLQPSYSQEGTKVFYNVSGLEEPVDSIKIRLNYFSLPLLLKVQSTSKRFYALGGIEAGYLLDSYKSSHDVKEEIETDVSELNIAAHFGAGFRIPIGFTRLFIELRYTQGILNLSDEPIAKSTIPRVKTTGFKILTGIEIPLKKSDK